MDPRPGDDELTTRTELPSGTTPDNDEEPVLQRRSLTHDTFWSVLARGTHTVGAVIVFWMLARYLGEEQYGLYAAAMALFLLLSAFVTLGTFHIVVQRVSRDPSLAGHAWGAALVPGLVLSVAVAAILGVLAGLSVPGMDGRTIFILALAEFIRVATTSPAGSALVALDRFPTTAALTIWTTLLRVGFLGIAFFALDLSTLRAVAVASLAASLGSGLVSSIAAARIIGLPRFSVAASVQICRDGSPFSLTQASGVVLGDIDKQMLIRLDATPEFSTGIYSAGNRVLGLAAAPLYALLAATYPRFFAKGGEKGLFGTWSYSKRLMRPVTAYALAAGAALFAVAPLIDDVLGAGYSDSIGVIRLMALVPVIHLPALLAGEALTGAGHQGTRNRFIIGAGVLNVALNLALIGPYGVTGAILATYASEIFLLAGLIVWIKRKISV